MDNNENLYKEVVAKAQLKRKNIMHSKRENRQSSTRQFKQLCPETRSNKFTPLVSCISVCFVREENVLR